MAKAEYIDLDARGWLDRADHFLFSGGFLASQPKEMQGVFGRPHIVLTAFAAEGYLKSLLCVEETEFEKIHDLLALFDLLTTESQAQIEKWWNKESKPTLDGARKNVSRDIYKAPKSLRGALDESASAFLDWRYHGSIAHIGFSILGFPVHVRRRIFQLKPEWIPPPQSWSRILHPKAEFIEREDNRTGFRVVGAAILNPKPPSFKASLAPWRGANPKDRGSR